MKNVKIEYWLKMVKRVKKTKLANKIKILRILNKIYDKFNRDLISIDYLYAIAFNIDIFLDVNQENEIFRYLENLQDFLLK